MLKLRPTIFALFFSLTATLAQAAGLDAISTGDASAGVKEALAKGADYAVASLGKDGGFLNNSKVKIPLPGYLQKAESGLRMFGLGKQADELTNTMNHAAENATTDQQESNKGDAEDANREKHPDHDQLSGIVPKADKKI